jgi:5-methylcytosine-specific restriction endonuclease McrA
MRKKPFGAGILFQQTAQSFFLKATGQVYDNMLKRVMKKGFYGLPFDKEGFRAFVLAAMGGTYDGYFRCRYCNGFFALDQVSCDHAHALSKGGGIDLDNLEFLCKQCNQRKGTLKPEEYFKLLKFLDDELPMGKVDILMRLEISVQLAAADRARKAKERREALLRAAGPQ